MKNLLKVEEAAMFALAVYALLFLHVHWWVYLLLLIGPDISCAGYLSGDAVGAASYNLFHHKGIAIVIFLSGLLLKNEIMQVAGIVLFGHSSMDRMLGYGLKLNEGFKFTHLGIIGKK